MRTLLLRFALVAALTSGAGAQLPYTIEALPSVPGADRCDVLDVGGLGQAVGSALYSSGAMDAVSWSGGTATVLPPPAGGPWYQVQATGVSSAQVVGNAYDATFSARVAIRWTGGVPALLPIPPGVQGAGALAVAENGVVAGFFFPPGTSVQAHACRWTASGVFEALPEPAGSFFSQAVFVREDGTVVGEFGDGTGVSGVCAWNPAGQLTVLADLLGEVHVPAAMAADGSVYGAYRASLQATTLQPYRLAGSLIVLPTLPWQGSPLPHAWIGDADSSGRAVGLSTDYVSVMRAALWVGTNVFDLESLVAGAGGWALWRAEAIDEAGRICGNGTFNGVRTPFLLHPVAPSSYCTAGTSSGGCAATLSASGTPSASAASGFTLSATGADGQRSGLVFYGVSGTIATPWGSGTSFLCVKSPTQRTSVASSGGTSGQCDGSLALDWNAYMAAHPGALGNPRVVGARVQAQAWLRDPPAAKSTALSSAVEFVLAP